MADRLTASTLAGRRRRKVETLTPDLLMPRGKVSVMVGWQGIGKGTIAARIAADETHRGHAVGFVSDEDTLEETILPRLQAAGADVARIVVWDAAETAGDSLLIPRDNHLIRRDAERFGMRLLLLDPWTNHVDVADFDKGHVRRALMPLKALCADTGLCALLSAHPNRRDTDDPLMAIAHASAVSQVARCVYHVVIDPDGGTLDQKLNRDRLLIPAKANVTRWGETLRFRLERTLLLADDDQPEVEIIRADWTGTSPISDYAEFRQRHRRMAPAEPREGSHLADAADWLREHLASGPKLRAEVLAAATGAGHSRRTVERAYGETIGGRLERLPGENASAPGWWKMPNSLATENRLPYGETGETAISNGETGEIAPLACGGRENLA